jgi:hypothetical protein
MSMEMQMASRPSLRLWRRCLKWHELAAKASTVTLRKLTFILRTTYIAHDVRLSSGIRLQQITTDGAEHQRPNSRHDVTGT